MTLESFVNVLLQINMFHFKGVQAPNSPASLLYADELKTCYTCGRQENAFVKKFRASGSFAIEVYIEAGQKIAFFPTMPAIPSMKEISYQFNVRGHLISE
jgi:hypothetical protein